MVEKRIDQLTASVEEELSRLRERRPAMGSRISRAEHLLVTQLSVSNGTRPIKVKANANGHTYTVRSGSKLSTVYTVDRGHWTCDCPATKTCYHIISCWILERAANQRPSALPSEATAPCSGCGEQFRVRELQEIIEDTLQWPDGLPLSYFEGDRLCGECFKRAA